MKNHLRKLSLDALVQRALADEGAREAAQILNRDTYPSRDALGKYGLTEILYLALQQSEPAERVVPPGIIYAIAGGIASPFAVDLIENDLKVRAETMREQQEQTTIHVFLMIHGAIAPNLPVAWDFSAQANEIQQSPKILPERCELLEMGWHAHNLQVRGNFLLGQHWYERLSCGGGAENTLDTREQAWENYEKLKGWAQREDIPASFFLAEAVVPLAGLPQWRIFSDDWSGPYADRIDHLAEFRRPGDNYRPPETSDGQNAPQFSCRDYPIDKLLPFHALNDMLREIMQRDEPIVGIGCSDARQGLFMSDRPDQRIDASSAARITGRDLSPLRREHLAGHSEPLGLVVLGEPMQQIGCYLADRQFAILRREPQIYPRIFSQAWPFLINIPGSFWKGKASELATAFGQLLCAIDGNYRKGFNLFFPIPLIYLRDRDETFELAMGRERSRRGLQFIYPASLEDIVRHGLRPGIPFFKLNMEDWGASSHHVRANYDRRSVDALGSSAKARDVLKDSPNVMKAIEAAKDQDADIVEVQNEPLRKDGARANVGSIWPWSRRRFGIPVRHETHESNIRSRGSR
jgi:hypothetical protein